MKEIEHIRETIERLKKLAKRNRYIYKNCPADFMEYETGNGYTAEKFAMDCEQLIDWLEDLVEYMRGVEIVNEDIMAAVEKIKSAPIKRPKLYAISDIEERIFKLHYPGVEVVRVPQCVTGDCDEIRVNVINEFVNALVPRLTDAIYERDVESMTNLINDVANELKGELVYEKDICV